MRIQVFSDSHIEFHRDGGASFLSWLDPTDVDVLVVAGDLTTEASLFNTVIQLCDKYPHVVYVTGNHEYYFSNRGRVHGKLDKAQGRLSNFHWLHETSVVIDGQRFVGTTLWFAEDPLSVLHEDQLNDFGVIQGFRGWVYEANRQAVRFLEHEVSPGDVVVTHHVPSQAVNHPRWRGSVLDRFFVCEMGNLIAYQEPKLWCFGHTHDSRDRVLGNTRLVCNPFGYARKEENPAFDPKLVVEI